MIPPDILAKFEAAFFGRLSNEEAQALAQQLHSRPDWQEEVGVYEQLWLGLASLREEALRAQLRDWEAEAATYDEAELLEWYFQGQLSPANQTYIDQRRGQDPEFANRFAQYQQTYAGLEILGDEYFRKQIQQWDQAPASTRQAKVAPLRQYRRLLTLAASLLLLLVAGTLWLNRDAKPTALLEELYTYPVTGSTLGANDTAEAEYLSAFAAAHQSFQQEDYPQAAEQFTRLGTAVPPAGLAEDDVRYYQDNIEWMIVLARYGAGQLDGDFSLRLRSIADNHQHRFQQQAQQLQQALGLADEM
jgi:hypothetical protein